MSSRQRCKHMLRARAAAQIVDGDIQEHRPLLRALAAECASVTEMGVRDGISTVAFLLAEPTSLVAYDLQIVPMLSELRAEAAGCGVDLQLVEADVLRVEIAPTDLLFIDTLHTGEQLRQELRLHSTRVRKYIVLHDTELCGRKLAGGAWATFCADKTTQVEGLLPVVDEFLQGAASVDGQNWRLASRSHNNNGLTVLKRRSARKWG